MTALNLDRMLALDLVRVTEAAARAGVKFMGRGDKNAVDGAAVDAMREALNQVDIHGTVVIGEGEKDEAPMLYEGEVVGSEAGKTHGPKVDIAVDPVDGTTITANGGENAIAVIAVAEEGCFLKAPDAWYMEKLAVGPEMDISKFNLDMSAGEIVREAANQKGVKADEIVVCMLNRSRHEQLMKEVREAGARIKLISDGDVAGAIACCMDDSGVDILMGQGGSPEGVIAAAALKCLGGNILGRLKFNNEDAKIKAKAEGVSDPNKTYTTEDMAKGDVVFVATGVTDGTMLKGINRTKGGEMSHSIIMRSKTGTVRSVETFHRV